MSTIYGNPYVKVSVSQCAEGLVGLRALLVLKYIGREKAHHASGKHDWSVGSALPGAGLRPSSERASVPGEFVATCDPSSSPRGQPRPIVQLKNA